MKKILFIPLCFCFISATAQNEKAFTMASFRGEGGFYGATAEVTPDGKKLIVGSSVIDPYNKQQTELPGIGENPGVYTICYSPDHRYRVINKIDSKYYPVTNEKNKNKDWMSVGSSTDTSWHYKSYEDNYAVGVTDAGEVLVTKPSGFNSKYALKIEKMKGLWRFDPKTGTNTEVTGDVLFDDDYFNKFVFNTEDRKKFIVYRTHKADPPEIIVYDIATGNKHTFNAPRYSYIVSVGNDIVLLKNVDNATQNAIGGKGGTEGVLLSLDDGHELLASEQAINAANNFADYKLPNCFISGNKFYFLHPTDFSVVRMELENGKMEIKSITKLDTAGLKLALYSDTMLTLAFKEGQPEPKKSTVVVNGRSRYCLAVMKDFYVIFPETAPEKYKKPYPLFMYFMHPESGEAVLAMKPYFAQPVERNYAAEKAREEERKRMNEAECDRKAAVAPFHTGALLRKKSSSCKTPSFIWGGVNCETQQYVAFGITGSLRGYETISNPSELEVCDPGPYTICSYCRGAGSYKQWGTIADDGWKQTNFNVYVRNPNGVKAAQLDHICDVCKGKGYFR